MNLPPAHDVPESVDFAELCRTVIADPVASALDKFRAMDRLRQIEREREEEARRPPPPESFDYDDDWLAKTAALFLELGFADAAIEKRAQAIAAERVRKSFAVVDGHNGRGGPKVEQTSEEPPGQSWPPSVR